MPALTTVDPHWSPLTSDAATYRAWRTVWAARGTARVRGAVEYLVACAERATDEEIARRLELAAADGFDLRDLVSPSAAIDNAREAVRAECRNGETPIEYNPAALSIDECCDLMRDPTPASRRAAA